MADLSDVENVLVATCAAALYPNGTGSASAAGVAVTVIAGWPIPAQVDAVLAAGNALVSVFPMPGMDANTTRFAADMQPQTAVPAAKLTLAVAGNQITVGGAILAGEAATALVNYRPYSYAVKVTDTAATVAAALAALIPNATAAGSVITIASVFDIRALVSVPVLMQAEVARQSRVFLVSAWCPTPAVRDAVIKAIDVALKQQSRIVMPDNTYARMIYRGTLQTDEMAKQRIYRRDLRYEIEYVTTATETDNTVTNFGINITPTNAPTTTINI